VEESVTRAVVSGNIFSITTILSFTKEVFEFCIISELFKFNFGSLAVQCKDNKGLFNEKSLDES